ncbi:S-methyl-5'-thioadenosine phosphorylase isoform X8 [Elephas maximus indicus]|uniref:S-methyl-5'-thioadenosine phosphorylase isoform X8 n=1 Tax=Elephas maximus indicus TaxID=99487 RepID=UPI0021167C00|nr:S-methyl-5'-thioadenosine phosphorylase isoform X8 [Elephas maximus indicus]
MASSAATTTVKIGIIGGTGLDDPEILEGRTEKYVDTPFGKPSDALILGKIKNVDCVLLARHGRQHTIMPSKVNYQANIWALKEEGCTHVIVTTACGSLREEVQPGDIVIIDQFIDSCETSKHLAPCEQRRTCMSLTLRQQDSRPGPLQGLRPSMMGVVPVPEECAIFQWLSHSAPRRERTAGGFKPPTFQLTAKHLTTARPGLLTQGPYRDC